MRPLAEGEARFVAAALAPRLARIAGEPTASPAPLFFREVGELRGVSPHEAFAALAEAFEPERIEVLLGERGDAIFELDAAEIRSFAVEDPAARVAVFTRDFKFVAVSRPAAAGGGVDFTAGAPERFLRRLEEALPRLGRRPV
jgi:hypothetical protein